jgi:DNA mismatch endonuclease (patch repair protein)
VAGRIIPGHRDPLTKPERSELMSKVRSRGNRSTEMAVESALLAFDIRGWVKHPDGIPGRPDFYFPRLQLAVFVDGCFWHACPKCARNAPRSRRQFWANKLDENRRRDRRVRSQLRREGVRTMRIWEHSAATSKWVLRLMRMIKERAPDKRHIVTGTE